MHGQQNIKKLTCFGQFLCPPSGVFHCTHSNGTCHIACEQDQDGRCWSCSQAVSWHKHCCVYMVCGICHTGLLTACEQGQDVPSWSCSQAVWHKPLLCVQWKTPDDGQRNCPKPVEIYSKNKFEKLVHPVGFVIRIYHDVRSPERQICKQMGRGPILDGQATVICTGVLLLPYIRHWYWDLNPNSVILPPSTTYQPPLGQSQLLTENILEALPPGQIMKQNSDLCLKKLRLL